MKVYFDGFINFQVVGWGANMVIGKWTLGSKFLIS